MSGTSNQRLRPKRKLEDKENQCDVQPAKSIRRDDDVILEKQGIIDNSAVVVGAYSNKLGKICDFERCIKE